MAHASFRLGNVQICLDDEQGQHASGSRVSIMYRSQKEHIKVMWEKFIKSGATVLMPLQKTFYSEGYGIVQDQFGVVWQLYTNQEKEDKN